MGERRSVHVSFDGPGIGNREEEGLRNRILDKGENGLGWDIAQTQPLIVYRDVESDAEFQSALSELQQLVGGAEYASEDEQAVRGYVTVEADFSIEVQTPIKARDGGPQLEPGFYRVMAKRHWPSQGIDAEGAFESGDVWYQLDLPSTTGPVWVRESEVRIV